MNVYDFDKTIYSGDSSLDFYCFCIQKKIWILCMLPIQVLYFVLYRFGIISKMLFKEKFFSFLSLLTGIDSLVDEFWGHNKFKIKPWYIMQKKDDDVVISASPRFLLAPICRYLGIKHLIASEVDSNTGKFFSANCYGAEKVSRFFQCFPDGRVDEFYSDSKSDLPMAKYAEKSFLVDGEHVYLWILEDSV